MDDLDNEDLRMTRRSIARKDTVLNDLDNEDLSMMRRSIARKGTVIGRSWYFGQLEPS